MRSGGNNYCNDYPKNQLSRLANWCSLNVCLCLVCEIGGGVGTPLTMPLIEPDVTNYSVNLYKFCLFLFDCRVLGFIENCLVAYLA